MFLSYRQRVFEKRREEKRMLERGSDRTVTKIK
jgi:hypothetical protein